jgi:hypothetical protein
MGSAAQFNNPGGVAVDSTGNVYVADTANFAIRKVTPTGMVTTLAGGSPGSADGTGSAALFAGPLALAVDRADNIYVADSCTIRKVTRIGTNWVVTTLAGLACSYGNVDGTGSEARFGYLDNSGRGPCSGSGPTGVAVDSTGNIYVADAYNCTVRKVTPAGVVTTLAGLASSNGNADGAGSAARFSRPVGVAVDGTGNVYVADYENNTIRKGYPALAIMSSGPDLGFHGGQFGFDLTGPAGKVVVIQGSTDLVSWLPVWTNSLEGPLTFSDPQSGAHANRFYRAQTQ